MLFLVELLHTNHCSHLHELKEKLDHHSIRTLIQAWTSWTVLFIFLFLDAENYISIVVVKKKTSASLIPSFFRKIIRTCNLKY